MTDTTTAHRTPSATDTETLDRLLEARHSCRAFLPDPVPRPTIEKVLMTAQRTASWNNVQPWRVTIASADAVEEFRALVLEKAMHQAPPEPDFPFPREYVGVNLERRRACGFQLYDAVGVKRGDKAAYQRQSLENFRLFGAPHVAIVTSDEALGVYGVVDCGAYVSSFMLAAEAHGVASIAQAALAVYSKTIRAHFAMPGDRRVVCGISFGFRDESHPVNGYRLPRAGLDEVVQWVG